MFPREHVAGGSDPRVEGLGPGACGCRASTGPRRYWHLPLQDIIKALDGPKGVFADAMPVATGGRMIQRDAERSGLVQGRALSRQHADQRARPLVHVALRHRAGAQPRALQPRAQDRQGRSGQPAVADHRPGRPLRLQRLDREDHRRRTRHGRRPPELPGDHVWLLRPDAQGPDRARVLESQPRVRYYTMGNNKWNSSDVWPPKGAHADHLLPGERRQGQHTQRRRPPHVEQRRRPRQRRTASPTIR